MQSYYLHVDRDGNGGNFGGQITIFSNFLSLEGSNNVEQAYVSRNALSIGMADGSITPFLSYGEAGNYRIDIRNAATAENLDVLRVYFNADAGSTISGYCRGINLYASGDVEDDFYGLEVNVQNVNSSLGSVYAARFFGDVIITGALNFSGNLSIGKLDAFFQSNVADASLSGFNPTSLHGLITGLNVPANTTTANADMIGVNTASLIFAGENGVATSGPFGLGCSALALPAVVEMASGSSIQDINAAVYAINLSMGATGGTISKLGGCRSVFIPNGITTVLTARGFSFDLPFGPVNVDDTWAFYDSAGVYSYFKGAACVSTTSDKPTNTSIALEVGSTSKVLRLTPITEAQRDLLASPIIGMIIYNSTTSKFQGYTGASWENFN